MLPKGITSIGNSAFYGCSSLTSITLPEGITSIGNSAFYDCSSLTSITLPEGITSIWNNVFWDSGYYNDDNNWENGVLYIGSYLIDAKPDVISANYTVKSGTKIIVAGSFSYCSSLTSITLPDSVKNIGKSAFSDCTSLTSITIPNGVTISTNAFTNCTSLTTVTLDGVRRIDSGAFSGCSALTDIYYNGERNEWRHIVKASDWDSGTGEYVLHILKPDSGLLYETDNELERFYLSGHAGKNGNSVVPENYSGRNVVAILPSAFNGNKTLVSLELSDTITYIGDSAFKNCINLKEINIPDGVLSLEFGVFSGCISLGELKDIPINENDYLGYFFGAYSYKESETSVPEALKKVSVRKGSTISAYAFADCVYISQIILPEGLTKIGAYAFAGCEDLKSVNIPSGVTKINKYTFSGCSSLPDVELPDSILTIAEYAFENCISLANGSILPNSVTFVGDRAFVGCTALESFEIPDSVTDLGEMILDSCYYIRTVKLGKGLKLENIADYTEGKSLANGNHINGNPFLGIDKNRSMLEKYVVASDHPQFCVDEYGVLYYKLNVGNDSIKVAVIDAPSMSKLVGYTLPDHIVEICPYAFAYNTTITSIDLEYVRLVGNHAFYNASGLVYVKFGEPTISEDEFTAAIEADKTKRKYSQYVRTSAFMGCTALQSVNIETPMIVGIEELAFADCPLLNTVKLGENVQVIGLRAFGTTGKVSSGLERFIVDENNAYFKSIDGVLYRYNSDNMLTLVTYPALAPEMENGKVKYSGGKTVYRETFSVPDGVSAIESYAFDTARKLKSLTIDTSNEIKLGDYALANSSLQEVTFGENVVSIGLKRGEGEYTVFYGCNYLVSVTVDSENSYYSSKNGVLFNADKSTLIKYPVAKPGTTYTLPDTVSAIASMAFKDNDSLACVVIKSPISVIGLEAFYDCSTLSLIYFEKQYAPIMIMENAFTTYVSVDDTDTGISFNPRTIIGYNAGYYENGENNEVGWKNYENTYTIVQYDTLPDFTEKKPGGYYAVVVVDSNGVRLGNTMVSLTDPNGNTETVETVGGIATFTDLFGKTGLGFLVDYDSPYSVSVYDKSGEYFTYTNASFYLDDDMRITYITLTKTPSAYGVSCGDVDINSETAEINKSEYGYTYDGVTLIDAEKGYVEDNIKYGTAQSETIEVRVIGYCEEKSGWLFDPSECVLRQNGIVMATCDVEHLEKLEGTTIFTFQVPVKSLMSETEIEAYLVANNTENGKTETAYCSTALNIHVFEFLITADDVEINSDTMSVDLQQGGDIITKLLGSASLDVNIGKNVLISVQTDGSEITLDFSAKTSKKFNKSNYDSYKKGYESVCEAHNKNTYFFTFNGSVTDTDGKKHDLVYNIRFARDKDTEAYFYYRCYRAERYAVILCQFL